MDKNRWFIFGAICIAIFGILIYQKSQDDSSVDVSNIDAAKVVTKEKQQGGIEDHVFGTDSQKVVLVEYGDFQCPGCGSLYPKLHTVKEKYKDQLTFVFRNFPLTSIHPNALVAATAAEAAGLQGKWWEYHDKLFENQSDWSNLNANNREAKFEAYAKDLGLNTETFTKDLSSKKIIDKIDRDRKLGKKAGADSTPTLILNGKKLAQGQWTTEEKLEETIREAIKGSGQELPKETGKE